MLFVHTFISKIPISTPNKLSIIQDKSIKIKDKSIQILKIKVSRKLFFLMKTSVVGTH